MNASERAELRVIVREELRALLSSAFAHEPDAFSTRKGHAPEGWTDEAWKSVAATIPGAYRPKDASGKPGRWTIVPRAAFDAWLRAQSNAPANDGPPAKWTPEAALAAAGLRATR